MTLVSCIFRFSWIRFVHSTTRFRHVDWPFPNIGAVKDWYNHGLVAFHEARLETVNGFEIRSISDDGIFVATCRYPFHLFAPFLQNFYSSDITPSCGLVRFQDNKRPGNPQLCCHSNCSISTPSTLLRRASTTSHLPYTHSTHTHTLPIHTLYPYTLSTHTHSLFLHIHTINSSKCSCTNKDVFFPRFTDSIQCCIPDKLGNSLFALPLAGLPPTASTGVSPPPSLVSLRKG